MVQVEFWKNKDGDLILGKNILYISIYIYVLAKMEIPSEPQKVGGSSKYRGTLTLLPEDWEKAQRRKAEKEIRAREHEREMRLKKLERD